MFTFALARLRCPDWLRVTSGSDQRPAHQHVNESSTPLDLAELDGKLEGPPAAMIIQDASSNLEDKPDRRSPEAASPFALQDDAEPKKTFKFAAFRRQRAPAVSDATVVSALCKFAAVSAQETFALQPPSRPAGLFESEVQDLRAKHGPNVLTVGRQSSTMHLLFFAAATPFNGILIALAATAIGTGDRATFTVMLIMVVASTILRFVQEKKSTIAAARLVADNVSSTCYVLRKQGSPTAARIGEFETEEEAIVIPRDQLVPGDVLCLAAGDVVPADGVVISSNSMLVNQATLTGEIFPVEKVPKLSSLPPNETPDQNGDESPEGAQLDVISATSICLSGTSVVSGSGRMLVLGTGDKTYMASIAGALAGKRVPNSFELGIRRVSYLLIIFCAVMTPIVFIIQGLVSKDWKQALLFSISVAVGLTPEMLPMVVNSNLAIGALKMARDRVIVKRLDAVQNLGGCTVFCSDKTGSLTKDEVELVTSVDGQGKPSSLALRLAFINAHFQTGSRSLLDAGIVGAHDEVIASAGITDGRDALTRDVSTLMARGEVPFDSARRLLTIGVAPTDEAEGKSVFLITKGAVEELVSRCTTVITEDETAPASVISMPRSKLLTTGTRADLHRTAGSLNREGLRLVGVAVKASVFYPSMGLTSEDESDLCFVGFLGFLDPPKPDAKDAIDHFRRWNVDVKILTGDSPAVAVKVARDIGLLDASLPFPDVERPIDVETLLEADSTKPSVVTGNDLCLINDGDEEVARERMRTVVQHAVIFAKLSPHQKLEVVDALRSLGHTVAFLGDGVNDSLALRRADVGIAVDAGTDIAKDAADIILLEKSLAAIGKGMVFGRVTMVNTLKYIKMAASSNFGNVFSVLVASAWLPFTPMAPLQLLVQNLLYDFSQASIPWDNVDKELLEMPRSWGAGSIATFMIVFGPTSSVFDICTFCLNWFFFGIRTGDSPLVPRAQTHWFLEGLLTQLLVVYSLRTPRIPFLQSRPSISVLATTLGLGAVGIAIPFIPPIASAFSMMRPAGIFFAFLVPILSAYLVLVHIVKQIYLRIWKGEWI